VQIRVQRSEEEPVCLLQRDRTLEVDCPRIKDKNRKESKTEVNLSPVVSTQSSTSQAGGSDSDLSVFSFSVTTPIVGCLGDSKWILDIVATYHACSKRD